MLSFLQARERHAMVAELPEELGRQVYEGVTAPLGMIATVISTAVTDTTPPEIVGAVESNDIAAAFAARAITEAFLKEARAEYTPWQARRIAVLGWAQFTELARTGGYVARGLGADGSSAWPILLEIERRRANPEMMRRIAERAGRLERALRGSKDRRVRGVPEEVSGVTNGDDFADLVPDEYALLATPATARILAERVVTGKAQVFERRGTERAGRGPLVLLVDGSGSMHKRATRNVWAKAAMTAMTKIAWSQNRPVVVVHFSTATKVERLEPGDHMALLGAQALLLDGGTATDRALRVGRQEALKLGRLGSRGADVVLISDGQPDPDCLHRVPGEIAALHRDGMRLYSVAIELEFHGALRTEATDYVRLTAADMERDDAATTAQLAKAVRA